MGFTGGAGGRTASERTGDQETSSLGFESSG